MYRFKSWLLMGLVALLGVWSSCGSPVPDQAGSTYLTNLTASVGVLSPAFAPTTEAYTLGAPLLADSLQLSATVTDPAATLLINGKPATSGVASPPIPLAFGVTMISVAVQAPGAPVRVYAIAVTRSPTSYLKASNTGVNDAFGISLALSGDTLAVGASGEDSNATGTGGNQADNSASGSGAVYVFVRSGTVWTQQAYLKASNTDAGDGFGSSVALSGDTLAVGAPFEASNATGTSGNQADNSASGSGAVYVFVRSGTMWTQQAYVKASNTEARDGFGWSVALSGDTLAAGALYEASTATGINGDQANNNAKDSGAVYVFVRSGTKWTQQAYVKASNTGAFDAFGQSVSLSGDTLAVGAWGEASSATGTNGNQADNSAPGSGAVYLFVRSGTTWTQQAYLKASNTGSLDLFGYSVALSGETLAVGAPQESSSATGIGGDPTDNGASKSGAVYLFVRSGTTWTQQAYVKASNTEAGDGFGYSVALSGDTLVVGAPFEASNSTGINGNEDDNGASKSGAVYTFVRSGTSWSQSAYVKASNTETGDGFGSRVALSGDTLAGGAYHESSNATGVNGSQANNIAKDSGAVYLY